MAFEREEGSRMTKINEWLSVQQPRLHGLGLMVLLISASLTAPFSLDMYTPSIPYMAGYFSTTDDIVNLTLLGYFLFMAVGLLVFGPLSDKYGRRPVLLLGTALYAASSMLCALSASIWMLVFARIAQALGSGAMGAVATAVVKDAAKPEHRERMLAIMQVMFVIGPVTAPIIGAAVLSVTDWRATFCVLTAIGILNFLLAMAFSETLHPAQRTNAGVLRSLSHLGIYLKNKAFVAFLAITSAFEIGYMAYVSVGSYIYMDIFGFSSIGYGVFFAMAAMACAIGPLFWIRASRRTTVKRFTSISLLASCLLGVAELLFGHASAHVFCIIFLLYAFFESTVRPYSINVLLSQNDTDAGSASALINCIRILTGCCGMIVVMLPWSDYIVAVSTMMILGMAIAIFLWVSLLRSRLVLKGVKDAQNPEKVL